MTTDIGFSGTREGMTRSQLKTLRRLLAGVQNVRIHHGDCVGADHQAHLLAREHQHDVVVHPPSSKSLRAYCLSDETREPKPYLQRNRDIVDESSVLIATPATRERARSGTWSTVAYAEKVGKPVLIIMPSGECFMTPRS